MRNFYDDDDDDDDADDEAGDEETGTAHKRTLSAPPVKPKERRILRVRPSVSSCMIEQNVTLH